jgi:hypothetical protein
MLLDFLWVIAISAALVVFFVFYLAFAYLLFSPLFHYLIEAWKPASRSLPLQRELSGADCDALECRT